MKRLLGLLGTTFLTVTTSTSLVACDESKEQPKQTEQTKLKFDIVTRIPNSISLGQLSTNTVTTFKNALQANLITIPDLNRISTSDYDVYKAGAGENLITDSDIATGDSLSIKIIAKGDTFTGTKDNITANYSKVTQKIDIATRIPSTINLGQLSTNTVGAFKTVLQANLINIPDLNRISTSDYDVYKAGTGEISITDSDIADGNSLSIKIVAKGNTFTGTKDNITANYSKVTQKIDIATRIPSTINLGQLSANTVGAFKTVLQANLINIQDLNNISTADYDVYKAGTGEISITDSDIADGNSLSIKIVAKGDIFTGTKDNITANYSKVTQKIDIATRIPSTISLGQLSANTVGAFKTVLQANLINIQDLNSISTSDYDVYKAGTGEISITDSDIADGNSLSIKIVAKGNTFTGTKDNITANYTKVTQKIDIATKIPNTIDLGQLFDNTVGAFKTALQANLINIQDLNSISTSDYDVYKAGIGEISITDSDIADGNSLSIKIVAKGNTFTGTKDNITANYKQQFTSVPGWEEGNGAVRSLLKVGSDIYVGTLTGSGKGKLFKIDSSGALTPVSGWEEGNGAVRSLTTVGSDIYVGTYSGGNNGKLFKIDSSGALTPVSGWEEGNDAVRSLTSVGSDIYVGTYSGKLFKIDSSGALTPVSGWQNTNGAILSLTTVGSDIYVGTLLTSGGGKLFKINSSGALTPVTGWQNTNGTVLSLTTVGSDIYVGTYSGGNNGKLFKIDNSGAITPVTGWQEGNGTITSLVTVGSDIYVGTWISKNQGKNQGKLFKIDSSGALTPVSGWQEDTNGAVTSLLTVDNDIYVGTLTDSGKGKLLYKHI